MIDDIKRWLDGRGPEADARKLSKWLRWCISEIERLREDVATADALAVDAQKGCDRMCLERNALRATNQEIGIERDEALEAMKRLLGQCCETCGRWYGDRNHVTGQHLCGAGGPSWLAVFGHADVTTLADGGAGCDNYEKKRKP